MCLVCPKLECPYFGTADFTLAAPPTRLIVQHSTVNLDELLRNHHEDILTAADGSEDAEAEDGMFLSQILSEI